MGLPWWLSGKESTCNAREARDAGSIPRLELSPGKGNSNPLQYSYLENPTDRGAWRAAVHRVANSRTQLKRLTSIHTHTHTHMNLNTIGITFTSFFQANARRPNLCQASLWGLNSIGETDGKQFTHSTNHYGIPFMVPRTILSGKDAAV